MAKHGVDAAEPVVEVDDRYSAENAKPTAWSDAREVLADAELYWVTTVRSDGRPHVTPVVGVWSDHALYFSSGPEEQKSKNIAENAHCLLTTGCNRWAEGLDLVVEGDARTLRDDVSLRRVADTFAAKYGEVWRFEVRAGAFHHDAGEALVYEVEPVVAYAFGKGEGSAHTRYRFD